MKTHLLTFSFFLCALFGLAPALQAQIVVVPANGGSALDTNFSELGPILLYEINAAGFSGPFIGGSLKLGLPAGYEFDTDWNTVDISYATPEGFDAYDIFDAFLTELTDSSITIDFEFENTPANPVPGDSLWIEGLRVRAKQAAPAAAPGNLVRVPGTNDANLDGIDMGTTNFASLSQLWPVGITAIAYQPWLVNWTTTERQLNVTIFAEADDVMTLQLTDFAGRIAYRQPHRMLRGRQTIAIPHIATHQAMILTITALTSNYQISQIVLH